MVTTMATRHHNQSASRMLWELPLKSRYNNNIIYYNIFIYFRTLLFLKSEQYRIQNAGDHLIEMHGVDDQTKAFGRLWQRGISGVHTHSCKL